MFFDSRELNSRYFNPRSHKGSDVYQAVYILGLTEHFNPRSHKGSDKDRQMGKR